MLPGVFGSLQQQDDAAGPVKDQDVAILQAGVAQLLEDHAASKQQQAQSSRLAASCDFAAAADQDQAPCQQVQQEQQQAALVTASSAIQGPAVPLADVRKALTCQLCHELVASSLVMQCSHVFCGDCLFQHLSARPHCPQCQVNLRAIPVRCLALDSVAQAFSKTLDVDSQARYENRAEEGKAAANKLNKMFWWLQSPMAISGPEAVGANPLGGMQVQTGMGQQNMMNNMSRQSQNQVPPNLMAQAAGASLLGRPSMMNSGGGASFNMGMNHMQNLNAAAAAAAAAACGGSRVRPPSSAGGPLSQGERLPPRNSPLFPNVSVPHGSTDRVARSQPGNNPISNANHARRNSEGSNGPFPGLDNASFTSGGSFTGRRSFCNSDGAPFQNSMNTGNFSGNAASMLQPFLQGSNSSGGYNPLADLQEQLNMFSNMAGNNMMNSGMIAGQQGIGMSAQDQQSMMVQQLLQQMYLNNPQGM